MKPKFSFFLIKLILNRAEYTKKHQVFFLTLEPSNHKTILSFASSFCITEILHFFIFNHLCSYWNFLILLKSLKMIICYSSIFKQHTKHFIPTVQTGPRSLDGPQTEHRPRLSRKKVLSCRSPRSCDKRGKARR